MGKVLISEWAPRDLSREGESERIGYQSNGRRVENFGRSKSEKVGDIRENVDERRQEDANESCPRQVPTETNRERGRETLLNR